MESIWRDVVHSLRGFGRSPAFTCVAVLTLALGIAANTAIFSVVDAVLLRPLPVKDPARIVVIHDQLPKLNLPRTPVSGPQYMDYSRQTDVFESTAAYVTKNFTLTGLGSPERLQAGRITAGFLPLLGIEPVIGRTFTQEDDRYGAHPVAMLSFRLWRQFFNTNAAALGQPLTLDGKSYEVVGVLPARIEQVYPNVDIWIPMAFSPAELSEQRRSSLAYDMLGRLKTGVGVRQAQSAMAGIARNTAAGNHSSAFGIEVRPIIDEQVGDVRGPLYILLAAVFVVLMISCANIASLLLARASGRARELAIRIAVGAGRARLMQQLLTESLMLSVLGGTLGVLLARWGLKALVALAPPDLPRLDAVALDARVLFFALLVSLGCGIVFGLFPAFAASKINLVDSLKESGKSEAAGASRQRFRGGLVITEVALAFTLLFSAGLLLRSFGRLLDVKPGFNPHNILTMRLVLPHNQQPDYKHAAGFFGSLLQRVRALPGVRDAAVADEPPFTPGGDNSVFSVRNYQPGPGKPEPHADYLNVTADYLKTMGIPLINGRNFTAADMVNNGQMSEGSSVIIDESLAKRFWTNGEALGRNIGWGSNGPWATVVGIAGSVTPNDLSEESKGTIYFPDYSPSATLVVRTANDPHNLTEAVRAQVQAVDRDQPVYDMRTMDERIALSLESRRFAVMLLGIFAALALTLAAIGLYGVIAYLVTQRTNEIGIRMALGAARGDILRLVIRHSLLLVSIGLGLGFCGSIAASHYLGSLLYNVPPIDGVTLCAVSVLLATVGAAAALIPARRAITVDPLVALRYQ